MGASEIRELLKLLEEPDIISFAGGIPDPALFPDEAFKQAYSDILSGPLVNAALQYSASEGYRPLREWLVGEMTRSEEHTSELQSLMRISYAVFCLKKKKKKP